MRLLRIKPWLYTAAATLVVVGFAAARSAAADPTLVVKWNDVLLECVRRSGIGPPMK